MKKITLGIFIILAFAFNTRASHLMGGEIVVKVDSSNNAFFTLTLYRDGNPGSAGLGQTTSLQLSQTGITIPNVTLQRTSQTTLASSYLTEKHVYTSSMMLPNNGQYTASFSLCCRNGAIMNGNLPIRASICPRTSALTISKIVILQFFLMIQWLHFH